MAKKKRPSRGKKTSGGSTQRFANQASLEGYVRYNPQESALLQLAAEARSDAETTARDRVAAGNAIAQSARSTQKNLDNIYNQSAGEMGAREQKYRTDLANLGPAADQYKAGSYFTSTTADKRLKGEKASALADLALRQTDAKASARWGADQARSAGQSEIRKIQDKLIGVRSERGAYETGRMADLLEAQRERANKLAQTRERNQQSDRNSRRSANVQRERAAAQAEKDAKRDAERNKPKKPKLQTPDKHYSIRSEIDRALQSARGVKGEMSRSEAAAFLTSQVPETKDGDGNKVPGRKPNDQLTASIALDLAYDGGISAANVKRMHDQRLSLKQLGLADKTQRARGPRPSLKGKRARGNANAGRR